MAADVNMGMKKQDMQRLLMKSKAEPVNFAFGVGDDNSSALLLLDRVKQPKAVEAELTKTFPSAKNTRFGTAVVDVEQDRKMVQFYVNKPVSSMARKLVKTLKGTGFSKARILLIDGTAVEGFEEEDGEPQPAQAGGVEAQAPGSPSQPEAADGLAAASGAQPSPAVDEPAPPADNASPAAPDPAAPDIGTLTQTLAGLIRRIAQADPTRQESLKNMARQAGQALKTNGGADAPEAIRLLSVELDKPVPSGGGAAAPGPTAVYAKAGTAWKITRDRLGSDIDGLRAAFSSAFQGHPMAADLEAAFKTRVANMLVQFDGELSQKLDAVSKATDPALRARLLGEAKQAVQRYQGVIASDPTLAELEANPFVPLTIKTNLSATFSVIEKTLA